MAKMPKTCFVHQKMLICKHWKSDLKVTHRMGHYPKEIIFAFKVFFFALTAPFGRLTISPSLIPLPHLKLNRILVLVKIRSILQFWAKNSFLIYSLVKIKRMKCMIKSKDDRIVSKIKVKKFCSSMFPPWGKKIYEIHVDQSYKQNKFVNKLVKFWHFSNKSLNFEVSPYVRNERDF